MCLLILRSVAVTQGSVQLKSAVALNSGRVLNIMERNFRAALHKVITFRGSTLSQTIWAKAYQLRKADPHRVVSNAGFTKSAHAMLGRPYTTSRTLLRTLIRIIGTLELWFSGAQVVVVWESVTEPRKKMGGSSWKIAGEHWGKGS